jgi:surface protein
MMTRWYSGLPYVKPQFSEFIILVKTDNAGVSASNEILLPIQGSNMIIDWGDGNVSIHTQNLVPNNTIGGANVTHTYTSAGTYQIKISPRLVVGGDGLHRISYAQNAGDRLKILEINNWGKCLWSAITFISCNNVDVLAEDLPNLSIITSLSNLFNLCFNLKNLNGSISNWDISNINNMSQTFRNARIFNQSLNNWDVSNVTNLVSCFSGSGIIQSFSNWNVGNVTNMSTLFNNETGFFGKPSNIQNWDVSKVTTLSRMFDGNNIFNESLANWVLNPNVDLNNMLRQGATSVGMNAENYSRTLIGWANNIFSRGGVVTGRSLGASGRQYNNIDYVSGEQFNNAVDARDYLVNTLGWTITGDAQV